MEMEIWEQSERMKARSAECQNASNLRHSSLSGLPPSENHEKKKYENPIRTMTENDDT